MARTGRRGAAPPLLLAATTPTGFCETNGVDVDALRGLMQQWRNYPSSWNSGDPCGGGWDGVMCSNGRVTSL
ncbi:Os05g0485900 [Oryza sativa Japonica Group]|uniref:Leucine-rich repeat-containing N-terminal plant-type domain-containing protein n=3 Tax=Oryza TaxID=4527 RepID=A0A8J8XRQ4_ORYSJ|nr:hypothetical protein OsJ_18988 [Oryza sativa Japonica Group]BAS94614.1 Os05g0485900 [Oryza sativa Japonica Group]